MPAEEEWLAQFFTYLTLGYAVATVQICACAVAAMHQLNSYDNLLTPALKSMLKQSQQWACVVQELRNLLLMVHS